MLDIGWTELLVIAIVLIVVVGPKDLPPMLRAFGKMTANLRKMAGEFRTQFDEALRESELDEVRQTISDAQKLNPSNALRDAINPLRQMGQEIRSDLQKATQVPAKTDAELQAPVEGEAAKPEPALAVPASAMTLPSSPPETLAPAAAEKPKRVSKAPAKAKPAETAPQAATADKPKRSRVAAKPAPVAKAVEKDSAKAPARKRASKKTDTPKDDA
ncbi:Sec-independent protein translocase protein TatB [Rhizobium sp. LC145]|uniref:Sec-independent protein translocase protein TatB n=1 Tax=Rhizobium sp. LC145 TaxID=1120688 RepID=UPI000629F9F0|nr:Sec-independent protein translocase protein TatB [Rhizobium sp. LC145]KKX25386.1 preprotein translocase [Rhizobium sp. LC145]TKT46707.1 twin-arginine translocase subunit TatB [Rhizobiaceae bacterium LC148]